jgi:hypothetical protein
MESSLSKPLIFDSNKQESLLLHTHVLPISLIFCVPQASLLYGLDHNLINTFITYEAMVLRSTRWW